MAVRQLRCDKFVVFFAREMYILNLRCPGVTKVLREKLAMDQVCDQPGLNVLIIV